MKWGNKYNEYLRKQHSGKGVKSEKPLDCTVFEELQQSQKNFGKKSNVLSGWIILDFMSQGKNIDIILSTMVSHWWVLLRSHEISDSTDRAKWISTYVYISAYAIHVIVLGYTELKK